MSRTVFRHSKNSGLGLRRGLANSKRSMGGKDGISLNGLQAGKAQEVQDTGRWSDIACKHINIYICLHVQPGIMNRSGSR